MTSKLFLSTFACACAAFVCVCYGSPEEKVDRMVAAHEGGAYAVAFSPDGSVLATGGADGLIKLWKVHTLKRVEVMEAHEGTVYCLAFSCDGERLASGGADACVRVWDVRAGGLARLILGHQKSVRTLAYSPDGKYLATGSDDSSVKLWDADTLEFVTLLADHDGPVRSVCFLERGRLLATSGDDGWVRVWNTDTGEVAASVRGAMGEPVLAVAVRPGGGEIAFGYGKGGMCLWSPDASAAQSYFVMHTGGISSIDYHPGGAYLATGSYDWTYKLWLAGETMSLVRLYAHHDMAVSDVRFNGDGSMLAAASLDGTVDLRWTHIPVPEGKAQSLRDAGD